MKNWSINILCIFTLLISLTGCSNVLERRADSSQAETQSKYKYQVQFTAEATEEAPTEEAVLQCAAVVVSDKPLTDEEVKVKLKEGEAHRTDIVIDSIDAWQIEQIAP